MGRWKKPGKKTVWIVVGLIFVVLIGGGVMRGVTARRQAQLALQNEVRRGVPVETLAVGRDNIETYTKLTGQIQPQQQVTVTSKAAGKILRVNVKAGDRVSPGTILAQLEGTEIGLQVEQARTNLELTRATYDNLIVNKERMDFLYDEGVISQKDWEDFNLRVKTTEGQLRQLEIGLELAQSQQDNLTITSPISGVVTNVMVEAGNNLAPGTPVMIIADMGQVYAQTNLSETLLNTFKIGQEVNVTVRAIGDEIIPGTIDSIDLASNQTRLYPMKILLPNGDGLLRPGMFAEVNVREQFREDVIVVPREAVIDSRREQFVFVEEDGVAVKTVVQVGIGDGRRLEILGGLTEGQQLIVVGHNFISDGDEVEVRNRGEVQ